MKYDLQSSEGRSKAWAYLNTYEASNDRTARVGKIKNLLVTLVFAFNSLIYIGYLADFFVRSANFDPDHFGSVPFVDRFIAFVSDNVKDDFVSTLVFGFVFLTVVPAVFALVVRIILSLFIRKRKVTPAELPENEEEQIKVIMDKDTQISKKVSDFSAPYGICFSAAGINTLAVWVASAVILFREKAPLGFLSWILFIGVGLLVFILTSLFGFLTCMSFSMPFESGLKKDLEEKQKKLEEEMAEKERAEKKALEEAAAREEQERIDKMTGDELYEYASMLEDDDIKLRYLHIAEERGSEMAPFLIKVIHEHREAERYKRSRAHMEDGWEAQRTGDYRRAQRKFRDAAMLDNPDGMYNYARLCLKFGERQEAIRWLEKAIESGTYDDTDTHMILAAVKRGEHINIVD